MTELSPNSDTPQASKPPARLPWLTVPLTVSLVFQIISLLALPFSGGSLNSTLADYDKLTGLNLPPLTPEQISAVLWISFVLTVALILWLYNTRRGLLEGKSWGRTSAIVIAVLSLLMFPFGTLLGIVMLIGAFDRDVVAYTRK